MCLKNCDDCDYKIKSPISFLMCHIFITDKKRHGFDCVAEATIASWVFWLSPLQIFQPSKVTVSQKEFSSVLRITWKILALPKFMRALCRSFWLLITFNKKQVGFGCCKVGHIWFSWAFHVLLLLKPAKIHKMKTENSFLLWCDWWKCWKTFF